MGLSKNNLVETRSQKNNKCCFCITIYFCTFCAFISGIYYSKRKTNFNNIIYKTLCNGNMILSI